MALHTSSSTGKCVHKSYKNELPIYSHHIFDTKSVNWEENRELGVVRLHIFNSRISNSRKIHGPKKRELGGHTVHNSTLMNSEVYA